MIREVNGTSAVCALLIGTILNLALIWMIKMRSPPEMDVYKRILFQTCFTNLAVMLLTLFVQPIFASDKGVGIVVLNGPINLHGILPENVFLFLWDNFFFFSFFGFCAQFVYRFMILNQSARISIKKYVFCLSAIVGPLDFFIASLLYWSGYPDVPQTTNPTLLTILNTQNVIYLAQKSSGSAYFLVWFLITVLITLGYMIIFLCIFAIRRYVRNNFSMKNSSQFGAINYQLDLNMLIQSTLPFFILMMVWFTMIVSIFGGNADDSKNSTFLQVMMLIRLPAHWIPVLNPLVTMLTVKCYNFGVLFAGGERAAKNGITPKYPQNGGNRKRETRKIGISTVAAGY